MAELNFESSLEKGTAKAETYARKRSLPEVNVAKEIKFATSSKQE